MNKIIVDVGFHKGEDTGFYLYKGFDVIAIDASKELVEKGNNKFINYIKKGQLKILNFAVSDNNDSEIIFYTGENTLWNSTNKNITNRKDSFLQSQTVKTITLEEVFKEYGTPYYCKIDIEGADILAIHWLNKDNLPQYISCESECYGDNDAFTIEDSLATLYALRNIGYKKFKLIDQRNFINIRGKMVLYGGGCTKNFIKRNLSRIRWEIFWIPTNEMQRLSKKHNFPFKWSSGPGPLDHDFLNSEWLTFSKAKELILYYREQKLNFDGKNLWIDLHAFLD